MGRLFDILKKHKLIPEGLKPEEERSLQADFDEAEALIAKPAAPAPVPAPPKPGDPPPATAVLDPAVQAQLDALAKAQQAMLDSLSVVTKNVQATETEKAAAAKAALAKRYTDHVEKLATEGRITKAQKDDYLKPEVAEKNIAGIEVFEQTTSMLPVNPAFQKENAPVKGAAGQIAGQAHAPATPSIIVPGAPPEASAALERQRSMEQAVLQEIAGNMQK